MNGATPPSVGDTGTLSGTNVSTATGTVTYTVYKPVLSFKYPFIQLKAVASGGTVTVTAGEVPASSPVTLPAGLYELQAVYSGDAHNAPSKSRLGHETEVVLPAFHFHW